jgi:hypothetical protein
MRLLNTHTLKLEEFGDTSNVVYAILSHTWREKDITFQDMECGDAESKAPGGCHGWPIEQHDTTN